MPFSQVSNAFVVEIDGQSLPDDVDLTRVSVDDHLLLPDAFELTFRDGSRQVLAKSGIAIGSTVTVSVLPGATMSPRQLVVGEVTALEAEVNGGASYTIVRGYDQSHRLTRGRVT